MKRSKEKTEYVFEDLLAIARGEKTKEEIAEKYNVSVASVYMAMSRRRLFRVKTPVVARYNGKTEIFPSIAQCSVRIGVSQPTIKKSLNGHPTILDDLGIVVEEYYEKYCG